MKLSICRIEALNRFDYTVAIVVGQSDEIVDFIFRVEGDDIRYVVSPPEFEEFVGRDCRYASRVTAILLELDGLQGAEVKESAVSSVL